MKILSIALVVGGSMLQAAVFAETPLNGGELYSLETVKYGRWELRMQFAATPGSVSSFFTFYNSSYLGEPEPWREIDIEVLGKTGYGFQSNLITGSLQKKTTSEQFHASVYDLSNTFHTYVLDWTPDSIVYRLDGVTLRTFSKDDPQVKELTDKPQSYRMNLWASTVPEWVGRLDMAKLPVVQTVNWIAYSAYTPGKGPDGSDFTPAWTDDFNSLDSKRWACGTWTFETNMAQFTPENIKTADGYLMIILSKKDSRVQVTPAKDPVGNTYTPESVKLNVLPKSRGERDRSPRR
jgi:endo-1,3-1,4-beta-glycanase ExoK